MTQTELDSITNAISKHVICIQEEILSLDVS